MATSWQERRIGDGSKIVMLALTLTLIPSALLGRSMPADNRWTADSSNQSQEHHNAERNRQTKELRHQTDHRRSD
jgi:hypothetical protein